MTPPTANTTPRHQLPALTSLRFFLAFWVVIFHQSGPESLLAPYLSSMPPVVFNFLRTGYVAVGLFFALSGFVLALNYDPAAEWNRTRLLRFFVGRFSRIYPVYAAALLVSAPQVAFSFFTRGRRQGITVAAFAAQALSVFGLVQAWFPAFASAWIGPAWSLSAEAFYYACFPFIGRRLWRMRTSWALCAVVGGVWLTGLCVPALSVLIPIPHFGNAPATSTLDGADPIWTAFVKFNPLFHISEFCAGVAAAKVYLCTRDNAHRAYLVYIPALVVEALVILQAESVPYPLLHDGVLAPAHAALILGVALAGRKLPAFLSSRFLVFMGKASYSLYMIHVPVLNLTGSFWVRVLGLPFEGILCSGVVVCLQVGLACLCYSWIEAPMQERLMALVQPWLKPAPAEVTQRFPSRADAPAGTY